MTTFSFTGFSISYDTNDDPVSVGSASLAATFQDDQAVLNYSVLATEAGEVPDVDLGGTDALGATINGAPINDDADEFLGSVQSAEGTHVIMGFFDPATNQDFIFRIGGDPLTVPTTLAELQTLNSNLSNQGTATGAFAPDQDIPFTSLLGASISEDDTIIVDNDEFFVVDGGVGDDTIDMSGLDTGNGYAELHYSGLTGPISVDIDGAANTGSVVKTGVGTDTLIGVENPLFAGFTAGGLLVEGTGSGDTFNLNIDDQQWMELRPGGGQDQITLTGDGLVRLDFREAANGIDVDLRSNTINDDGFGFTETINGNTPWSIRGSAHDDAFTGGDGDDKFRKTGGNDDVHGGSGSDRLRYESDLVESVSINAAEGTATGTLTDGATFNDTFSGFETFRGSDGNDEIAGDGGDNRLEGRDGDDIIGGGFGNDFYRGGSGADTFVFSGGFDFIDDFEVGVDTLLINIPGVTQADVDAAMANPLLFEGRYFVTFGEAQNITFNGLTPEQISSIPALLGDGGLPTPSATMGTAGDDTLTGTAGDDTLSGLGGSDFIDGREGDDLINPGDNVGGTFGGDFIVPGLGNDTIDLSDTLVGYVGIGYGFLNGLGQSITVNIDGGTNFGEITYSNGDVDEIVNVNNTLFSGFVNGGISIRGTASDDTFNLTPEGEQWMSLRAGAGTDSYSINGTGLVRLDFRDAVQGIEVDFATRQIADDGFGNAETIGGTGALWEVQASGFDDVFTGSSGDESYRAYGGNNTLDGGEGFDRLRYDRPTVSSVNIDATAGVATGTLDAGGTFTDTITGFEHLRGSDGDDQITGAASVDNLLEGQEGSDTFVHLGGNDTITDFDPLTDALIVRVAGLDQAQVDAALTNATEVPGGDVASASFATIDPGVRVDFGGGNTVTLGGVTTTDLASADVQFVDPSEGNLVQGTDGSDNLNGTAGDDLILTGDNVGFDFVTGSTGDDTIDMSGISDGYVGIDYGGLDRIDAVIDGGTNTGSVAKFAAGIGAVGTDTLIDVENPLFSAFTITGGLSIRGTDGDDTFDVTPQGEQWMSIRPGAGIDSYTINGTGLVRLDFRDATEAINVNLGNATGQVINDGFGNTETVTGTNSVWGIGGSGFDDIVNGSGRDESYTAFGGNNDLDGGGGFDRVRYDRFTIASVNIDAENGVVNGTLDTGGTFTDTITGFEHFRGSDGNDQITGEAAVDNLYEGKGGTDTFVHLGGNDTIADFDVANETLIVRVAGLDQAAVDAAIANATAIPAGDLDSLLVFPKLDSGALVDFGGGNTVAFGNLSAADLAGADVQFVQPGAGDLIEGTAGDDNLNGTPADDTILGFGGNDVLNGGDGDDLINPGENIGAVTGFDFIDPGAGNDTIDMSDIVEGYVGISYQFLDGTGNGITANIDGAANTGSVTSAVGTDTLIDAVNPINSPVGGLSIRGSDADDVFTINLIEGQFLSVKGNGGSDTINASGPGIIRVDYRDESGVTADLAAGTVAHDSGTDTINGAIRSFRASNGNDSITGSAEDEWFIPQAGNDTIDGGGGTDTLRYGRSGTTGPLEINFATGVATGSFDGQAFTDSFSNIERVRGTRFDDTIIGDAGDQIFAGNVGDDTITGGGGADTYVLGHVEVSVAGDNGGTDTITDFEIGTDAFDFSELGLTNNQISAAFAGATDTADGARIDFADGTAVIFQALTATEVTGIETGIAPPPPPPPTPVAWAVGDPHLLTLDGVGYDFHAIGEFVLLRGTGAFSGFEIQSRMGPVLDDAGNPLPNVSANIAIAAQLGDGREVMIDAADDSPLSIGGTATVLADGDSIDVGTDRIFRDGDMYTVVFAGQDGTVGDGDARLDVIVRDGFVDVGMQISAAMAGQVEGLLGDGDGNPDNDIALANGTVLERPLAFEDLYGNEAGTNPNLRDNWRVTTEEQSLFTYDAGETLAGFYDPDAPGGIQSVADFDQTDVGVASQTLIDNGLQEGTLAFDNALLDVLTTGDETFVASSSGETAPTPENTGSAGTLAQGEGRVTLNVNLTDEADVGLDGAVVNFSAGGAPILGQAAGIGGSYSIGLGALTGAGRVDAVRSYNGETDADIRVDDALNALRLAVGLDPSFGEADPMNFIAADVNQDGRVSVGDALDILRFAVGLETENAPRWVFLDEAQDLTGTDERNVGYETGRDIEEITDGSSLDLTGVLLGDLSGQPVV